MYYDVPEDSTVFHNTLDRYDILRIFSHEHAIFSSLSPNRNKKIFCMSDRIPPLYLLQTNLSMIHTITIVLDSYCVLLFGHHQIRNLIVRMSIFAYTTLFEHSLSTKAILYTHCGFSRFVSSPASSWLIFSCDET